MVWSGSFREWGGRIQELTQVPISDVISIPGYPIGAVNPLGRGIMPLEIRTLKTGLPQKRRSHLLELGVLLGMEVEL